MKLVEMPRARQAWEVVGGPVVSGAATGLLLGTTVWLYLLSILVAVVGGIGAGPQQSRLPTALLRGAVAGTIWGISLLAAHALSGATAVVELPDPQVLFLPFAVVPPVLVCGVGWAWANRRRTPVSA